MDIVNGPPGLGTLQFLTGSLAGSSFQISKPTITIGREPSNDIVVVDPSVSRHHAQISFNNGEWVISKLAAQNVVTVNQRNVQQSPIRDRDTIGLGADTTFRFQAGPAVQAGSNPNYSGQRSVVMPSPPPPQPTPQQQPFPASPPQPPPYQATVAVSKPVFGTQRAPSPGAYNAPPAPAGQVKAPQNVPSLEVSSNIHSEKQIQLLTKQVVNIGRHPDNDIVIKDPVVSGFHAQIVREGDQLVLIHPNPKQPHTTNGLLYQGRHIPGDQQFRKALARGDIFRIGDEHGTLITLTFNDGTGAPQDIIPEIHPIPLGAPVITLGRLPDNTVVLNHPQVSGHHAQLVQARGGYRIVDQGSTNHVYVNAQQAKDQLLKPGDEIRIGPFKLTYTGTQLTQHDESSSIRIDALHLKKEGNKHVVLIDDISIAIPPRKFVALVGGSGAGKSTLMDALNGLRPAQQGAVLYNGQDYYKHLAAFSTQLGYVPQEDIVHRDLTVERVLYYAAKMRLPGDFTDAQIKQRIDEVLDDVEMTFRRKLMVSKLSGGQRKRVSIALELLANPSVFFLDEPTSGLDPGLDRKMMFLLRKLADKGHTIVLVTHATNNINACDYVCFLCQGGRLAYFGPPDEAKVFFGKTDFAEIYSALEPTEENKNIPAEAEAKFKASPDFQKFVVEPLNQGPAGRANAQQMVENVTPAKLGNPWKQFRLQSMRYVELLKNDVGNLMILLLQAPIIAIILFFIAGSGTFTPTSIVSCLDPRDPSATVNCSDLVNALNGPNGPQFVQLVGQRVHDPNETADQALSDSLKISSGGDAQKIIFIMAFAGVFFGCINGAREIVKEAPIYRRERTVNLGIAPYMFSKIVVLGTLCLIQSFILVVVVNFKAPFHQGVFLPVFIEIYITMALASLAGLMIGLAVSALAPNNDRAMSFIPIILIPQVIFAGSILPLTNVPLQLFGALFPVRWAMAAMGTSIGLHGELLGSGNTDARGPGPIHLQDNDFAFRGNLFRSANCNVIPDVHSCTGPASVQTDATIHLLLMWVALVITIVVLGIATAYFLKRKDIRR